MMGSSEDEFGRNVDEDQHEVTLTKNYYIGVFEITQKQYELITGSNPSAYKANLRPVEKVSYNMLRGADKGSSWPFNHDVDEESFFGKLRAKTEMIFDLPTESQWEYACRAQTTTALNNGKDLSNEKECKEMAEVGRYFFNRNDHKGGYNEHTKVGSYFPNAWGLYDMHGNVVEWCLDWYQFDLSSDPATEPFGASRGKYRVIRGGEYYNTASGCRSASRGDSDPGSADDSYGFRVVLVQQ